MTPTDPVVLIAVSDIHLSLRPPVARSEEEDWLDAQLRPWRKLVALKRRHPGSQIVVAGDLFDRWNPPLELVNWAMDFLPSILAIPGNHDLPSHRLKGEHRSGYGSLVRAGKIEHLDGPRFLSDYALLAGFPFGKEPELRGGFRGLQGLKVAVIHEYLWTKGTGYKGAPDEQKLSKNMGRFSDFDVVLVGDNHHHFIHSEGGTTVVNCGTLTRRKANEADYSPTATLVYASGKVRPVKLDPDYREVLSVLEEEEIIEFSGLDDFVGDLLELSSDSLDFREALLQALDQIKAGDLVRSLVKEAVDG